MSSTETSPTARILTTAEFHAAALEAAPVLAVFDCDGTLWSGDAGSGFMRWSIEQGLPSPSAVTWLNDRYQGYLEGQVSELEICGEMVQVYAGLREADMRAAAATYFATHVERKIFPEMELLIRELQFRGVEIWAVSSTCDWVIEEGASRFHIPAERVLAARVQIDASGLVTNRLLDVPTDEGKVASLARVGITIPDAVFGNSIHDAAMLAIARSPNGASGAFAVNPSPELLARATTEAWPVFYPASVMPKTGAP